MGRARGLAAPPPVLKPPLRCTAARLTPPSQLPSPAQDATLFHCLMYRNGINSMTLVGRGAATDSLVMHLLPKEYSMTMGPGESWGSNPGCGRAFLL
jgi:hypothetical protein